MPYFKVTIDPENYYYSLLAQYCPFQSEHKLLDVFDTAKDAFLAKEETIKQISNLMEKHGYRTCDQQLQVAFEQAHTFVELENYEPLEANPDDNQLKETVMDDVAKNVGQHGLFN